MKFVLDSSAIVPILHTEDQSENALRFVELCQQAGIGLAVSPLIYCEVGNCIVQFSKKEKKNGQTFMNNLLGMHFESVPMTVELLSQAMSIAQKRGLTYYDAVHAATANTENAPLITLDNELLSRVKNSLDLEDAKEYVEMMMRNAKD